MNSKTYAPSKGKMIIFFIVWIIFVSIFTYLKIAGKYAGTFITLFMLYIFIKANIKITLSETNIAHVNYDETIKSFKWNEIKRISDYKLWMRVFDDREESAITISMLLEGYSEIKEWIAKKRPDLVT